MGTGPAPLPPGPIQLRWRQAGVGRPLVLMHCFPLDGRIHDPQLEAARDGTLHARVIVPDLPGFGESPFPEPPPDVLEIGALAGALSRLLRDLDLGPAVIGGVAIGGYIAIELAAQSPELVRALVLMGDKAAPDPQGMATRRDEVARLALEKGSRVAADTLAVAPLGPKAGEAARARMHELISSEDPRAIAALVRGLALRPDPTPELEALQVPVLVIHGMDDPFTSVADARRLAEVIPRAQLVELPDVGHIAPLEAPDQVTAALEAFMAGLP